MNDPQPLSRRSFLGSAALGLLAIGGVPLLASCTSTASGGASTAASGTAALPKYIPITKGPTPDLLGNGKVQAVFFKSPARDQLFTSVKSKPGKGGTVSAFVTTYSSPPPTDNTFLDFIDDKLGTKLVPQITPVDSYATKMATMLAGGDIPDLVQFLYWNLPPHYPNILKGQFTDLSTYLSGDAIRAYPNLANIPTTSWAPTRINGRIYGVPVPSQLFGQMLLARADLIEKITGAKPAPKNKSDFTALCKELTSAKDNRYALAGITNGDSAGADWGFQFLGSMFGVPNNWELKNGKLTYMYETDGWLEMISYVRQLFAAGYYHPDTPTLGIVQAKTLFDNGTVMMRQDGASAILGADIPSSAVIKGIVPFAADGGKGINYQGSPLFSFTALAKSDPSKIKELLGVLNYLAAPFGSKEYFDIHYGKEGVHFTTGADGEITLTDAGNAMIASTNLHYVGAGPQVQTAAVPMNDRLTALHTWQVANEPLLRADPTAGLYSPSASQAGSAIAALNTAMTQYVLGHASFASAKQAVKTWTSSIGNTVRSEYEAALKKA